jgi:hypothetical protein
LQVRQRGLFIEKLLWFDASPMLGTRKYWQHIKHVTYACIISVEPWKVYNLCGNILVLYWEQVYLVFISPSTQTIG